MLELLTVQSFFALLTLTALELVLGIDNIVVLAIITSRLEPSIQSKTRRFGLALAMFARIALLSTISFLTKMTATLFSVSGNDFSGRDLVLLAGGLFLVYKAVREIHEKVESAMPEVVHAHSAKSFASALVQIVLLDIVFSLDSVITAVGMSNQLPIMIAAIVLAVLGMMMFADPVSHFVNRHPTVKILALAFILLIGVMLVGDAFGLEIPRGYIYFAMVFSLVVEAINIRVRKMEEQRASVRDL